METNNSFTALELWRKKGLPYKTNFLNIIGCNLAQGYRTHYGKDAEIVEIYEKEAKRKFRVFLYPPEFKAVATKILNRVAKKYKYKISGKAKKKRIIRKREGVKRERIMV
jgi:hypothetical protein